MKEINVGWQCASTLFTPTGIYGFKRIGKLKQGLAIYAISYMLYFLGSFISSMNVTGGELGLSLITILGFGLLSLILPIIFIRKWSIEYNQTLTKNHINN